MDKINGYPTLTAEEAASQIPSGATVAFSGFGSAGAAKAVPRAIAKQARDLHSRGEAFQIRVLTGASTGKTVDEELASAIRAAFRGESFLSPSVAKLLVDDYQRSARSRTSLDPYEQLTDRERDVLKLLAEGHTTQEIAEMLVVSLKTAEGHKTRLMAKLNLHNRVDLVKYALRKGIITV